MIWSAERPDSPASSRAIASRASLLVSLVLALTASSRVASAAEPPALVRANLDTTCAPCRDFYQFANGGWMKRTTIPAAYDSWGSFYELAERNQQTLYSILQDARQAGATKADADRRRLSAYWRAAMDSTGSEALGAKPIAPLLSAIDALPSKTALAAEVAWLHSHGVATLFGFRAAQDPGHSDQVIAFAGQGGLSLPDRDFYLRTDSVSVATRQKYVDHVARTLELTGRPSADAHADAANILSLETALATASMTNVERRDPKGTYHKMTLDSLERLCPGFAWREYLAKRSAPTADSLNVTQPRFFHSLDSLIAARPLAEWKAYLRWNVADDAAPRLTRAFAEEDFRFGKVLSGAEAMQPRWKRAVRWTDNDLGDLLGNEFVKRRFPPAAKARALRMVENLEAALGERIAAVDWMGEETRARAIDKLKAFANKIGYPDHGRDYAGVAPTPTTDYANHLAARAYEAARNVAKIGRPVDRGEWSMSAPTVNAYYSGSLNSINFPAGILQPPFYDPAWDDATNYGGIGAVIGHEMSHGFDDRGRQFDAKGNLRDWWTADDAARYKERANKVADQFSGYTVLDTVHVNGRLTLGENIADLGGVAVGYAALMRELKGKPEPAKIDGFTAEQRFFLSWAQVWRSLTRDESMRTQVQTDPHSPEAWRVNGPYSNLSEFAKAFGCKAGDPMVRPDSLRARIW